MHQRLALAQRRIVADIAERRATACRQASATSRWIVVNSNDSAGTGCVSPASASASNPSTSIFMKAGMPCLPISASSVVIATLTLLPQLWPSQPGAPSEAFTKSREAVETVGLSTLIFSSISPAAAPTATGSTRDGASRP